MGVIPSTTTSSNHTTLSYYLQGAADLQSRYLNLEDTERESVVGKHDCDGPLLKEQREREAGSQRIFLVEIRISLGGRYSVPLEPHT